MNNREFQRRTHFLGLHLWKKWRHTAYVASYLFLLLGVVIKIRIWFGGNRCLELKIGFNSSKECQAAICQRFYMFVLLRVFHWGICLISHKSSLSLTFGSPDGEKSPHITQVIKIGPKKIRIYICLCYGRYLMGLRTGYISAKLYLPERQPRTRVRCGWWSAYAYIISEHFVSIIFWGTLLLMYSRSAESYKDLQIYPMLKRRLSHSETFSYLKRLSYPFDLPKSVLRRRITVAKKVDGGRDRHCSVINDIPSYTSPWWHQKWDAHLHFSVAWGSVWDKHV